jgi:hypothetical protein
MRSSKKLLDSGPDPIFGGEAKGNGYHRRAMLARMLSSKITTDNNNGPASSTMRITGPS